MKNFDNIPIKVLNKAEGYMMPGGLGAGETPEERTVIQEGGTEQEENLESLTLAQRVDHPKW